MERDEGEYWNEDAGPRWALDADRLDAQLEPVGRATLAAADIRATQRILDVGCGAGWLTLAAAELVGPEGGAVGVDVALPLLEIARNRAAATDASVQFVRHDAQSARLTPPPFDRVVSRLGVMFFADSAAALRNLARSLRPGGRIAFACWGHPDDNPWMSLPRAAAAHHVELPPQIDPARDDEPGPFRLGDPARTRALLEAASLVDVEVVPHGGSLLVGGPGTLDEAAAFCMRIGPAASATRDADDATRRRVALAVRDALEPYAGVDGVRMDYRALVVTGTAPPRDGAA